MNPEIESGNPRLKLSHAIAIYVGCLCILFSIIIFWTPVIAILAYFALGVFLNRIVLRRLIDWHPSFNTLSNVATTKLRTAVFWIVQYPILFWQLFIATFL